MVFSQLGGMPPSGISANRQTANTACRDDLRSFLCGVPATNMFSSFRQIWRFLLRHLPIRVSDSADDRLCEWRIDEPLLTICVGYASIDSRRDRQLVWSRALVPTTQKKAGDC